MDDTIKLAVSNFIRNLENSSDEVWIAYLQTKYWDKKKTLKEWYDLLNQLKKPR